MTDLDDTLTRGRALAEALMTAECVITHPGEAEPGRWNPETLQFEPDPTSAYSGRCRLRPSSLVDNTRDVADQTVAGGHLTLSLPVVGSESVRKDDLVLITAYPNDAALVGRKFVVGFAPAFNDGTARRFPVVETQ